jgi:hypothetical protein
VRRGPARLRIEDRGRAAAVSAAAPADAANLLTHQHRANRREASTRHSPD